MATQMPASHPPRVATMHRVMATPIGQYAARPLPLGRAW
jgi:hypothetical protein